MPQLLRKMGGGETRDHQFDDIEYSFQQQVVSNLYLYDFFSVLMIIWKCALSFQTLLYRSSKIISLSDAIRETEEISEDVPGFGQRNA